MLLDNTPPTLQPKTAPSKIAVALGVLLLLSVGAHVYTYQQSKTQLSKVETLSQSRLAASEDKLKLSEEQLYYCYQDRATSDQTTESPYSFETFGIYSPLLEGTTVYSTIFTYKDSKIELKTTSFPYENSTASVSVWSVKKGSYLHNNFPIFTGYENNGSPTFLSELEESRTDTKPYKNNDGNEYYVQYHYAPHQIYAVGLQHFSTFSPLGRAMLVSVSYNIKGEWTQDKTAPNVIEAKQHAESIVDTIEIKL